MFSIRNAFLDKSQDIPSWFHWFWLHLVVPLGFFPPFRSSYCMSFSHIEFWHVCFWSFIAFFLRNSEHLVSNTEELFSIRFHRELNTSWDFEMVNQAALSLNLFNDLWFIKTKYLWMIMLLVGLNYLDSYWMDSHFHFLIWIHIPKFCTDLWTPDDEA